MLTGPLDTIDLISVDVFDTLLLRGTECEKARYRAIATLASKRLHDLGHEVSPSLLWRSRLQCIDPAYRAVEIFRPAGDVPLAHFHRLQGALLGLDAAASAALAEAEIETERRHLAPNRPLIEQLTRLSECGKRVVAVSDTYFSGAAIEHLLGEVAPAHPIARVYSSSDAGLTKRSGELFTFVADAEGVAASRVLHCGDDPHSDIRMARQRGLGAVRLGRPHRVRLLRRLNAMRFRLTSRW